MGSKNELTRKDFLTLTFTLIGTGAVAATCSSNNNSADGGTAGHGGTTGSGGTSHSTGQGGGGGNAGAAGGHAGGAGTSASGGGGGTSASSCADPLPETQVTDTTGHMHTVAIHPSMLDATTAQTIDTSIADPGTASAHMHAVTLEPAQLATLKGGGNVTVMSTIVMSHGHMFMISCH